MRATDFNVCDLRRSDVAGDESKGFFTLEAYPRAILHLDADAFFTSVEQLLHPELRDRPVVTGKERGIISCASYEAKARGISRGVSLWDARRMCPELVVLPSDYETYSVFSRRMFSILRRFTPVVEEHSVDEGFADITGLRRVHHGSYRDIAARVQEEIRRELGLSVSVGLSVSKVLAKLCSSFKKPGGITVLPGHCIHLFLRRIGVQQVWGVGDNTFALLAKSGIATAYDLATSQEKAVGAILGKRGLEMWNELRGNAVLPVGAVSRRLTISKCKSITVPSSDRAFMLARLVKNIESACIKMRRLHIQSRQITVALRKSNFSQTCLCGVLPAPSSSAREFMPEALKLFNRLYEPGRHYRTVMVVFDELCDAWNRQGDLFEDVDLGSRNLRLDQAVDSAGRRYGKHTVRSATSLLVQAAPRNERDLPPWRRTHLLPGETIRRRLAIPMLDLNV